MSTTARAAGLNGCLIDNNTALRIITDNMVVFDVWVSKYENNPAVTFTRPPDCYTFKPYLGQSENILIPNVGLTPAGYNGQPFFMANQLASIYNFPVPNPATKVVVGVLSFGGGLYGSVGSNGVLTGGDVQQYWNSIGIPSNKWPTVVVVPISGATNNPSANDAGATDENTLDVETIGACCPSANLTIILYIAPNSILQFTTMFTYAINTSVVVNGTPVKPTILTTSWGAPEIYLSKSDLDAINLLLSNATASGMNICAGTGDGGSNNGVGGTPLRAYCDFPASSPFVTAVGGTKLICPTNVYDNATVETAWGNGGGGVSVKFSKPAYQSGVVAGGRAIPDIAMNADPTTGVIFTVNNTSRVLGGTAIAVSLFAGFLAATNIRTFINPRLYTAGAACFRDVTSGSNGQYKARSGYDNCTGLGSINGLALFNTFGNVLATLLTLSVQSLTLTVGQVTGINYSLLPANVTLSSVAWSSSNSNIVSVNSNGVVTGVSVGTARVTCSTIDNSNISVTIPVAVNTVVRVASITLAPVPSIHTGTNIQLNPVVSPNNATNKNVTWLSSNPAIASVSATGLVSGLTFGTCVITCRTIDGNIAATVQIRVTIPTQIISVAPTTLTMRVGQTRPLVATVGPPNATNKAVAWSSANTRVALVNSGGVVIAARTGTTIINATSVDTGIVAQCSVTIS